MIIKKYEEIDNWEYAGKVAREIRDVSGHKESTIERQMRYLVNRGILLRDLIQINEEGPRVVRYKLAPEREIITKPKTQEERQQELRAKSQRTLL